MHIAVPREKTPRDTRAREYKIQKVMLLFHHDGKW